MGYINIRGFMNSCQFITTPVQVLIYGLCFSHMVTIWDCEKERHEHRQLDRIYEKI